jgi:hypothetical protein
MIDDLERTIQQTFEDLAVAQEQNDENRVQFLQKLLILLEEQKVVLLKLQLPGTPRSHFLIHCRRWFVRLSVVTHTPTHPPMCTHLHVRSVSFALIPVFAFVA